MISTEEFSLIFNHRHTFNYPDKAFLDNQYPNIAFKNIPASWLGPIDTVLSKFKDGTKNISSISQHHGFVVIKHNCSSKREKDLIAKLERDIKEVDIDLYEKLGECQVLN